MSRFRRNILFQFSIASLVIMTVLALGLASVLTTRLLHTMGHLEGHGAAMMSGRMIAADEPISIPHMMAEVGDLRSTTVALVAGGFAVLYASLFLIVWRGWRTIKEQQTQLLGANHQLTAAQGRLSLILDAAGDGICGFDLDGRVTFINPAAERLLQRTQADAIDQSCQEVMPFVDEDDVAIDFVALAAADEAPQRIDPATLMKPDGTRVPIGCLIGAAKHVDRVVGGVVSFHDATERQLAEDSRRNRMLVQEIHHRVKNNLQVVSSLLSMQARVISDEESRTLFQESRNRVRSMALIHEKLYKRTELATQIQFGEYLRELGADLIRSYEVDPERIALRVDAEDVILDVATATPAVWLSTS